jgi:hypothetical protein
MAVSPLDAAASIANHDNRHGPASGNLRAPWVAGFISCCILQHHYQQWTRRLAWRTLRLPRRDGHGAPMSGNAMFGKWRSGSFRAVASGVEDEAT